MFEISLEVDSEPVVKTFIGTLRIEIVSSGQEQKSGSFICRMLKHNGQKSLEVLLDRCGYLANANY